MTNPHLAVFLPSRNPTTRAILRCLVGCVASIAFRDRVPLGGDEAPAPRGPHI